MSNRASIEISDDRLEAHLVIKPTSAASSPITLTDIEDLIDRSRVVNCLELDEIKKNTVGLEKPGFKCKLLLAKGIAAKEPVAGELEVFFESGMTPGKLLDDERIDYTEKLALTPITEGQHLCNYRPPQDGVPGIDVVGKSIPVKRAEDPLPRCGKGVDIGDHGEIRANRAGALVFVENKLLDVDDCVEHKGPVDLHSGNLHSNGSLVIKGDVEAGFKVSAGQALVVTGHLNSGEASAGAAMTIGGCIYGDLTSGRMVVGQGGVAAKRALRARIESEGLVLIEKDAIDCRIRCESAEISDGKNGRLRGGSILAAQSVAVGETGSPSGISTTLSVASTWQIERQIKNLERSGNSADRQQTKTRSRSCRRPKGAKISRAQSKRQTELNELLLRLRREGKALLGESHIDIVKAYPGTNLIFGKFRHSILETKTRKRYRFDNTTKSVVEEEL